MLKAPSVLFTEEPPPAPDVCGSTGRPVSRRCHQAMLIHACKPRRVVAARIAMGERTGGDEDGGDLLEESCGRQLRSNARAACRGKSACNGQRAWWAHGPRRHIRELTGLSVEVIKLRLMAQRAMPRQMLASQRTG